MSEHLVGDVTIRPYDPDQDATRVRALVGQVWQGAEDDLVEQEIGLIGGRPWQEWLGDSVLAYLRGNPAFVAERGGQIIGFCSYAVDPARSRGTVGYNGVAREHQGLGIGSAMLGFVLGRMRTEGLRYAQVLVADNKEHLPAQRNYQSHGFRRIAGYHSLIQEL